VTVLGHLQRGGSPTAHDRVLATSFGAEAVRMCAEGEFGKMVALQGADMVGISFETCTSQLKLVPMDHRLIRAARAVGTSFGDELS
jgi:6-phosphofructokinase 1